jgi:SAM-dependent methyltransferase
MPRAMLNIGCGNRFHSDWINLDIYPNPPYVAAHNLRHPLPFANNTFEVVYMSHVLEHFNRDEGLKLLIECHRVCRPGGVIRLAIPDLEKIAILYLYYLDQISIGAPKSKKKYYDWIMMELFDQPVREFPGGGMAQFLRALPAMSQDIKDFVESRVGKALCADILKNKQYSSFISKLRKTTFKSCWYYFRVRLTYAFSMLIWGKHGPQLIKEALFRSSGEIHKWMYDRYSIQDILIKSGFNNTRICSAHESLIDGWKTFNLDTEPNGAIYKPDSLFCEAIKPNHG